MQLVCRKKKIWLLLGAAAAAVFLWKGRALVWLAARHLFLGWIAALAALPLMKRLEKHLNASLSAGLAIAALNVVWAAALFLLLPAVIRQGRQLLGLLPGFWLGIENAGNTMQSWLARHGVEGVNMEMPLITRAQDALAAAIPAVISRLRGMAGGLGQWLLAPVFGFYFLRDRHMISAWLQSLLPNAWRDAAVSMIREMKRETLGYLRGQLMVSGLVSAFTAVGLLFCGVPSWLALGVWMGVLELIPYIGPLVGGVMVALFTLPMGLWRTLWALGVVLVVQQLDGSVLTPKLISQTTRLHPAVVILCVVVGSAAAGISGVLLSVPLVLCLRAVWRAMALYADASF